MLDALALGFERLLVLGIRAAVPARPDRRRVDVGNIAGKIAAANRGEARRVEPARVTKERADQLGMVVRDWTPAEMDAFAKKEVEAWGKVIRDNNITMD